MPEADCNLRHDNKGVNAMGIIDAARRHFGPRWKDDLRVVSPVAFQIKLAELQKEISELQRSAERLRLADRRDASGRGQPLDGSDIRIISTRVEKELETLHGWTVSLVETVFILVSMEMGFKEEQALRKEWRLNM
jgi:hypothetical protein